jgi:hypothetical protein
VKIAGNCDRSVGPGFTCFEVAPGLVDLDGPVGLLLDQHLAIGRIAGPEKLVRLTKYQGSML